METTCTSGNLQQLLRLMDEKKVTPERFSAVLASGVMSDVLDPHAKLENRHDVRAALELSPKVVYKRRVVPVGDARVTMLRTLRRKPFPGSNAYHENIRKKDMILGVMAREMLEHVNSEDEPEEVDVVLCYLSDIGLSSDDLTVDVSPADKISLILSKAASRLGLRKLPQWAGPQLREEYDDQLSGESVIVITDPIYDNHLFKLEYVVKGKRWLRHVELDLGWGSSDIVIALALPRG